MSSHKPHQFHPAAKTVALGVPRVVPSLFDAIQAGKEFESIVSLVTPIGYNLFDDLKKGIKNIEVIRGRPCILYCGNVVRQDDGTSGVDQTDDLPFFELINSVPQSERNVDVFIATRGGSGQQIVRFVTALRNRFDDVQFIVPSFCMSAGTLFVLSGNNIWMTDRASLGPIDPQVPTKDGRMVPAQALLTLIKQMNDEGAQCLTKGLPIPWTYVRMIDTLDKKDVGAAITSSAYSENMAKEFLEKFKFINWTMRESSQTPVTSGYKELRAGEIAKKLASHDVWKNHGHSISRDVLWNEIKLKIDHPEPDFDLAIKRLWAVCHWIFDKTATVKLFSSANFAICKNQQGGRPS